MRCMSAWFSCESARRIAPDHVVRNVGGQAQVGKAIEQVQSEEQIRRHAVAVRLDVHRESRIVRQPAPAVDVRVQSCSRYGRTSG